MIGPARLPKLISTAPQDARAFASCMAARNVQTPPAVAHTPSPAKRSPASPESLTVSTLGHGPGAGVGVGVGVGVAVGVGVGVGVGTLQPFQFNLRPPVSPPHPSIAK